MTRTGLITFLSLLITAGAWATHNRAGEITYVRIGDYTYEGTITTYTVPDSPADRPELPLDWGDGHIDTLVRTLSLIHI